MSYKSSRCDESGAKSGPLNNRFGSTTEQEDQVKLQRKLTVVNLDAKGKMKKSCSKPFSAGECDEYDDAEDVESAKNKDFNLQERGECCEEKEKGRCAFT